MTRPTPETLANSARRHRPAVAEGVNDSSDQYPRRLRPGTPPAGDQSGPLGDGVRAAAGTAQVVAPVQVSGAGSLVKSLEALGVEVAFGIPGGAILPAYDPLYDSSVRHILVRHEQGAGHAATGYAQATGRVGVCVATSGPGATNLVKPTR